MSNFFARSTSSRTGPAPFRRKGARRRFRTYVAPELPLHRLPAYAENALAVAASEYSAAHAAFFGTPWDPAKRVQTVLNVPGLEFNFHANGTPNVIFAGVELYFREFLDRETWATVNWSADRWYTWTSFLVSAIRTSAGQPTMTALGLDEPSALVVADSADAERARALLAQRLGTVVTEARDLLNDGDVDSAWRLLSGVGASGATTA